MARKRADLPNAAGHLDQREAVWAEIRRLQEFTVMDLEDHSRVEPATIRTYVQGLTRAGYLEQLPQAKTELGRYGAVRWRLVRDVGVEAPRVTRYGRPVRQGQGREQMWRTMRVLGEFDWQDLAVHASTENCPIGTETAKDYIKWLHRAGYLHRTREGGPNRAARYLLLPSRYTGPRPPQVQRVRQVFDPNTGAVVWREGGEA